MENTLYYGDNLWVLREYIRDESVDLVYLDPPFNSKAQFNVLFQSPDGAAAEAQAGAFQDTWHWTEQTLRSYDAVMAAGGNAAEILRALRRCLGTSDVMAYLSMMAARVIELRRVLKATGSFYLHCDPTASHYLKVLLDGIFGGQNFRNEISWKRTHSHGSAKRYGSLHDVIFYYSKSDQVVWNSPKTPHDPEYVSTKFRFVDVDTGRRFQDVSLTGAGSSSGESGKPWRGFNPCKKDRHWAISGKVLARHGISETLSPHQKLDELDKRNLIYWPKRGSGFPRLKWFADELDGVALGDFWDDLPPINSQAAESVGYPTQKPLALLERIITASSDEGQVVLDPFCGCGTTVLAAQKLNRKWIGIDVTHYAITLIENRLKAAYPDLELRVVGRPADLDAAHDLARRDPYQFQWWANWLVGVQNYREHRKGADRGIDGIIYFKNGPLGTGRVIVSVKGGEQVSPDMVRALRGTVDREEAELGLFVTLTEPTAKMKQEAVAAGFTTTAHGRFPLIQIATIEDLLERKRPILPPTYEASMDEYLPQRKRGAEPPPQMEFTFALPGGKSRRRGAGDQLLYPAERSLAKQLTVRAS